MISVLLLFFAIIGASFHLLYKREWEDAKKVVETFLLYILIFNIGLSGLIGFIAHVFYSQQIAALIGFAANNPFQFEVGIANLSMAIVAFACIWQRRRFWLALILVSAVFSFGCAFGHLLQLHLGDIQPYHRGLFLFIGDIGIPFLYLTLGVVYFLQQKLYLNKRFFNKD